MATMLRVTSGTGQGCHYFDGPVYLYGGFGSARETEWVNDSRIIYIDDATSAEVTDAKNHR